MDTDERAKDGLVIGILDFPKGGTFGLDGQSIVLKTDDFLGVCNLPSDCFHLVTCKNGHGSSLNDPNDSNTVDTAVTVGFLVFGDESSGHLVRRYDPRTEEVASRARCPVDEITQKNLVKQMQDSELPATRVIPYDKIVGGGNSSQQDEMLLSPQEVWREQTLYIHNNNNNNNNSSLSLLKNIRKLSSGDKIVPGCYDPENEIQKDDITTNATKESNDGKSLAYPPIPVVDPSLSLAKHKHHGTNRFLSKLKPLERTRFFLSSSTENFVWLNAVLRNSYQSSWEALLGDLQLSYVLFLYLGCFSSLEHWKDMLAMLSLAIGGMGSNGQGRSSHEHESLYRALLRLLPYQLSSMTDPEFLEEIDEGGGNFLLPTLKRLKLYYETKRCTNNRNALFDREEEDLLSKFQHVLSAKFPQTFPVRPSLPNITRIRSTNDQEFDGGNAHAKNEASRAMEIDTNNHNSYWNLEEEDDEDGPVVVSSEEIEASMARSAAGVSTASTTNDLQIKQQLQKDYPLLAAAIMPSEDVLMTCARALDEKTDVSLVREAAAYLENVEQRRGSF